MQAGWFFEGRFLGVRRGALLAHLARREVRFGGAETRIPHVSSCTLAHRGHCSPGSY
jgi:hypothetical protein